MTLGRAYESAEGPPSGRCHKAIGQSRGKTVTKMITRGLAFTVTLIVCATAGWATIVDLTGSNESGTINGAQFAFTAPQPTGTGVIEPFLRVENTPTEQGYNTSGGTPFDVAADGSAVISPLDELGQLQLYTSSVGSQTTTSVGSLGTLR